MTGYEVYKMYLALKLHFTTDSYDYDKFHGKVKASEQSFEKRKDSYFFKKLASKYTDTKIEEYFVANFVSDESSYIKNMTSPHGEQVYIEWKKRRDSFTYNFQSEIQSLLSEYKFDELFTCKRGTHPPLLKMYFQGSVSLETLVVLNKCVRYVSDLDSKLTDPIWKDTRQKIVKYSPFIQVDLNKIKTIIVTEAN